ncbi:MAG: hypothetical protein JNK78_13750 [Planctomycetes bacterium]|nr:hypothetical protein [Planctomycetota bacterium]
MTRFLLSTVVLTSLVVAQEQAPEKVVSGAFGIDFTTAYFFRGIQQENQGIISQPWIELGYGLYEGGEEDTMRSLGLTFGLWNSLHDGPTGSGGGTGIWYESDFYVSLTSAIGERLSVGTTYTTYHSPNGTFGTVQELAFSAKWDDREQLVPSLASGLQPSVVLAFETSGQADAGNHPGVYLQVGIEPSFTIGKLGEADITLATPVTAGFSLKDYYEVGGDDSFFGFLDIGAAMSAPLSFLPSRMGPWTGEVGLHFILFGDNTEQINDGDASELVLSFGLSTRF